MNFKTDQKKDDDSSRSSSSTNSSIIDFDSISISSSSSSSFTSSPSYKPILYSHAKVIASNKKKLNFTNSINLNINQKIQYLAKILFRLTLLLLFLFILYYLIAIISNTFAYKLYKTLVKIDRNDESTSHYSSFNNSSNALAFQEEVEKFKNAINLAYLSVNKQFFVCNNSLDHSLKGQLNVEQILEQLNLNKLMEFYSNNSYDVVNNRNREDFEIFYLKFDSNKTSLDTLEKTIPNFNPEFYKLWHSTNISLLNTTIITNESKKLIDFDNIELGGHWKPLDCISRFKIAIIIPFRDRLPHLKVVTTYLHMFLQRQMLDYRIFVVEPSIPLNISFNKGRVMNSAFLEVLKVDPKIDCIIFHDVDLLPEDDRNMYTCTSRPRHLSVAIDKFNYNLPYNYLVGGVLSIRPEDYKLSNGYSNSYWGWGGEDDDYSQRLKNSKLILQRPPVKLARYKMMKHLPQKLNEQRIMLLRRGSSSQKKDGLNSVSYNLIDHKYFNLFTYFYIDVGIS